MEGGREKGRERERERERERKGKRRKEKRERERERGKEGRWEREERVEREKGRMRGRKEKATREGGREGKASSCTCFSFSSPTSSSSAHGWMGLSKSRAAPPTAPGRLGHFQCEENTLGSLSGLHLRIP